MKKHEIARLAQAEVMKLVAEGFVVDLMELTGSYSDIEGSQAVFAKGSERAVMWCERETRNYRDDGDPEHVVLKMARFTVTSGKNCERGYHWSHDWEPFVYFTATAWKIGDDWYTEDRDEAVAAREKSRSRLSRYWRERDEVKPMTDELLAIVRRVKGFKTAKRGDIEVRRSSRNVWTIRNKASRNEVRIAAGGRW